VKGPITFEEMWGVAKSIMHVLSTIRDSTHSHVQAQIPDYYGRTDNAEDDAGFMLIFLGQQKECSSSSKVRKSILKLVLLVGSTPS